jgi:hypothetical protein
MKYVVSRVCTDVRNDCQDRIGEACGFQNWKNNEHQGPFCKNYQRCHARTEKVSA